MTTKTLAFAAGILLASSATAALAANINGTGSSDILKGTAAADRIDGKGGSDWLYGRGGADTVIGGSGHDLMQGSQGNDILKGDAGNDEIHGNDGADQAWGGLGNDTMFATGGGNRTYGDSGNDAIYVSSSGSLIDKAWGGSGYDHIALDEGARGTFYGEDGDDSFRVFKAFAVTLAGGAGADRFHLWAGGVNPPMVTISDFSTGDQLWVEDNNIGMHNNNAFMDRFDANHDGVLSRADGATQTDYETGDSYEFVPAGLRLTMGTAKIWLPRITAINLDLPGQE